MADKTFSHDDGKQMNDQRIRWQLHSISHSFPLSLQSHCLEQQPPPLSILL